ncbi:unnamed protein product [Bursaphelenchus okinawaensis]|uniref:Chitin-binding type-2 domain-containing protein n=1 Tax=Bursaphelenchus okinawaensis TaxID=465554 RepID=A0A811K8B4_9BILA|nr:unnamed protein product [Bursaphelenchus okinawaensis]CAG9093841.1 unnamed protein product [Bursaphelenchus okinawaensis]
MILQGTVLTVLVVFGSALYVPPYGAPPQASTVAPAPVNVAPTTTPKPEYDCSNKNGYYTQQACGPVYYYCSGGHTFKQVCPPGTGYDVVEHVCEYLSLCGKPRTTTTAAPAPVNVQPTTTPSTECVGRPDGIYERGTCQNSYLHCANGNAYPLACPAQLAYFNGTCIYVGDCLSPSTTTAAPAPVNVAPVPAFNPYAPPSPPPPAPVTAPPAPVNVQSPAPQNPYAPAAPAPVTAPPAPVNVQPPAPAPVTAAPAPVAVQPQSPYGQAPVTPVTAPPAPVNVQPATTTVAPVNFDCTGRQNGQYSNAWCGQQFFVCYNGVAYAENCPTGTGFDVANNQCEWLAECGKPKTTTAAPVTAPPAPVNVQPPAPQSPYGAPVTAAPVAPVAPVTAPPAPVNVQPPAPQSSYRAPVTVAPAPVNVAPQTAAPVAPVTVAPTTAAPVNFDCSTKTDGYYGQGCNGQYFSCAAGSAYVFACPGSLKFSSQASQCDYPQNIPECGGQLPTTTAAPAPVNVAPSQPAQQSYSPSSAQPSPVQPSPVQTAPVNVVPASPSNTVAPVDDDNLCANLANGVYGRRCSRHYFVCSANKTYQFTCPQGFAYDPETSQCAPKGQVRVCAALTSTTTAAPAPVNVAPQQPFNPYAGY